LPDIHHTLGPSSAERWLACPGSVIGPDLPQREAGDAADEGTACHKLLEICLSTGVDPALLKGSIVTVPKWPVTDEMIGAVRLFLDSLRGICLEHGVTCTPETVVAEQYMVDETLPGTDKHGNRWHGGTCDVIVRANGVQVVGDLKYGRKPVHASSKQLTCYQVLALKQTTVSVHKCVQFIVQPRSNNGEVVSVHVPSIEEIRSTESRVLESVQRLNETKNLPASPLEMLETGSHCKYCPRQVDCPAQLKDLTDILAASELGIVSQEEAGLDRLVYWLDKQEQIEGFFKLVYQKLLSYAEMGVTVPGKKLVTKMTNRFLIGTENLEQFLADLQQICGIPMEEAMEEKVKGITALEAIIKARHQERAARKEALLAFDARFTDRKIAGVRLVDADAPGDEVIQQEMLDQIFEALSLYDN
jgi:hypothetical protein